jgi:hypothetical protein
MVERLMKYAYILNVRIINEGSIGYGGSIGSLSSVGSLSLLGLLGSNLWSFVI